MPRLFQPIRDIFKRNRGISYSNVRLGRVGIGVSMQLFAAEGACKDSGGVTKYTTVGANQLMETIHMSRIRSNPATNTGLTKLGVGAVLGFGRGKYGSFRECWVLVRLLRTGEYTSRNGTEHESTGYPQGDSLKK